MRLIDADALQLAIVEEGQANKRKKYIIGDIWELTGAEIREVINSQPTIQPEPHWIPVTERLPTEGESVLLGDDNKNMTLGRLIRTDDGYKWDIYAWWHDLDDWSAWMPLPEPYKGVTDGRD